jgi:hypothetical protein
MTDTSFPFHCELTQHLKMRAQFSDEPKKVNEFSNPDGCCDLTEGEPALRCKAGCNGKAD